MPMRWRAWPRIGALLAAWAIAAGAAAQDSAQPERASVWTRVLFDAAGRVAEAAVVEPQRYPDDFVRQIVARVSAATITPPQAGGQPATLRTGMEVQVELTPGPQGATVRVLGVRAGPIPMFRKLAALPRELRQHPGWEGEVTGICTVGIDGRCSAIEVQAPPGAPESYRRRMKASLEMWEFEPQQVNGQPVEGRHVLRLRSKVLEAHPQDFRQDRFERILRQRG